MINVKFYLDKPDKNKKYPVHLVIRQKDVQIKVATGEKINKKDWDTKKQSVIGDCPDANEINAFLCFLKHEVEKYFETAPHSHFTEKKIKEKIQEFVLSRKENVEPKILTEEPAEYQNKQRVTFIDLFAGAGGFSEGFLQAEHGNFIYDFLVGSDINENCELTHLARYNYQLGMDAEFLRQDITEPDFLDNLLAKINGRQVDVVCGGPPCQSFSLAGKRKKFDKKDDLFSHYLKIIRKLRPKYFVMENVKGILTKEKGKICEMILQEIRSIVDLEEFPQLLAFVSRLKKNEKDQTFLLECYNQRLRFEMSMDTQLEQLRESYLQSVENRFKQLTPKIVDYKTSKTDIRINTIRRGFSLLKRSQELASLRSKVIHEKNACNLHNDFFSEDFDTFLTAIDSATIIDRVHEAFEGINYAKQYADDVNDIVKALEIYDYSFDECVEGLRLFATKHKCLEEFENLLLQIRLYQIEKPFVALASNYGVPQNRERVLFIGCRKDQQLIKNVPATVTEKEKVTVFEALYDLDFVGNGDEKFAYENVDLKARYNGSTEKMLNIIKKRAINGKVESENGMTYAEWSRKGRLNGRFVHAKNPFYVRNFDELGNPIAHLVAPLHNHKTSKQNTEVIKRLNVILGEGDYADAKKKLRALGLDSDKRNYNVLKAEGQSPTVMTIPDDYIHFASPRALTVREMARLQSFDDSFVFQGKRSTGGDKRKSEVPQYTLVGNAVPPLLARAVAIEVLKHIK
ncbi:hypothetical protein GCM10023231_12400 [Olivibacter ginsenosidimutans]|uniref:DNA (cytosine-5-)-methyltransferase n=1 Tax=Olivibacter ginsenosidimutans TaxID=1176537 RepID=A0ABP9AUV5_9SPHI